MKMCSLILFALSAVLTAAFWQRAFAADSTGNGNNRILWTQNFPGMVSDCAFMPDENYIIDVHDTLLEIRRTIDGSLIKAIDVFDNTVSLDVSKDGKYVAISGDIRLLDINTLEVVKDFKRAGVSVSLSPDNKRIAFGFLGYAYVLDVETGQELFKYGRDSIDSAPLHMWYVKFSPNGKWLACSYDGLDNNVYVFDTDSFKLWNIFKDSQGVSDILFSPNSKYLLLNNGGFRIWDIESKTELPELSLGGSLYLTQWFNDSETLLIPNWFNNSCYFYSITKKAVIKELKNFCPPIGNGHFNSDETLLLGDRLGLVQIDKSILSVGKEKPNDDTETIFPNPTTGKISLKLKLPYSDIFNIDLYDFSGNKIRNIQNRFTPAGIFEINYSVSFLPVGTYLIKVTQKDFSKTFKLVKEG